MPQRDRHLAWCLNDQDRLRKTAPDDKKAWLHLRKSEYDAEVMRLLEKEGKLDWAVNAGYYAMYHCFLALITAHGFESRNQSCTVTAILALIEQGKIDFDTDLVMQFDSLEPGTARRLREDSTYGIETSLDMGKLEQNKILVERIQKETIDALSNERGL